MPFLLGAEFGCCFERRPEPHHIRDGLLFARSFKQCLLRSLQKGLVKIDARVVRHGRYVIFQVVKIAVPRKLVQKIL